MRKWAAKIKIEGVIDSILSLMNGKANNLSEIEKICVICFDEVYTSQHIEIDRKEEKRIGPHKSIQVGMARGLFSKWKLPIYFAFDKPLSKATITNVIEKLYDSGYVVVAVTTDLGPSNAGIWSLFNVGV